MAMTESYTDESTATALRKPRLMRSQSNLQRSWKVSVLVNAVCSGLTATYPGAQAMGARPIPEGAARIIWAATLSDDGPTAGFFRDGQLLPWQASNESLEYLKSWEYWRILRHAAVAPPDFSFENHNAAGKECTGDMINK